MTPKQLNSLGYQFTSDQSDRIKNLLNLNSRKTECALPIVSVLETLHDQKGYGGLSSFPKVQSYLSGSKFM